MLRASTALDYELGRDSTNGGRTSARVLVLIRFPEPLLPLPAGLLPIPERPLKRTKELHRLLKCPRDPSRASIVV